jgi:hypothetical protein
MHIQFVGIPSSGKSTLSKALVEKYPKKYKIPKREIKSLKKLIFNEPKLLLYTMAKLLPVLKIVYKGVSVSKVSFRNKLIAIAGLIINLANFFNESNFENKNNKIILWDELLYQRGLSIFGFSDVMCKKSYIRAYSHWVEKTCETEVVLVRFYQNKTQRLKKRGLPRRLISVPDEKIDTFISIFESTLDTLLSDKKIISNICTDNCLESNVDQLHCEITKKNE